MGQLRINNFKTSAMMAQSLKDSTNGYILICDFKKYFETSSVKKRLHKYI